VKVNFTGQNGKTAVVEQALKLGGCSAHAD
jgi:hypothetical protein